MNAARKLLDSRPSRRSFAICALGSLLIGALGLVPWGYESSQFVFEVLILAGVAVSWNVLGGFAGQLSLGHAALFGAGAYFAGTLARTQQVAVPLLLLGAMVGGVLVGCIFALCFRARGAYFAILTLALTAVLHQIVAEYAPGKNDGISFDVFSATSTAPLKYAAGGVGLSVLICWAVTRSRLGMAWRAIRIDVDAARALGVGDLAARIGALMVSSALAGFFGGVYALNLGYLDPPTAFAPTWLLIPLLATVLGGAGTLVGPLVGALLWTSIAHAFPGTWFGGGTAYILEGALLILITLAVKQGVWGVVVQLWNRLTDGSRWWTARRRASSSDVSHEALR